MGSFNRPPLAYACELRFDPRSSYDPVAWWLDWCDSQEGTVGHGGRELGSRIYDAWTVAAAVMAKHSIGAPRELVGKIDLWLRRHWVLQALGAVEHSQGQSWYDGPSVSWTGMRSLSKRGGTAVIRGENNELDSCFAQALGLKYRYNREQKSVGPYLCRGYDLGLTQDARFVLTGLLAGRQTASSVIEYFAEDLEQLVTRVPIHIERWTDGSAGTLVKKDIGTSTPPVYGMVLRGGREAPATYLATYSAGERYIHGTAWIENRAWWAEAGSSTSIQLPQAASSYTVLVDSFGLHLNGELPIGPPVRPPVEPPVGPPSGDLSITQHLEAAIKTYGWGDPEMSLRHTRRAESLLVKEIG